MAKSKKSDYDYAAAYLAQIFGAGPMYDKKSKHYASRVPSTAMTKAVGLDGRILKSMDHPTFHLTEKGERAAGYTIRSRKNRKLYSGKK